MGNSGQRGMAEMNGALAWNEIEFFLDTNEMLPAERSLSLSLAWLDFIRESE